MQAFSPEFQTELDTLMAWRRDVRRFRTDPVDEGVLDACLNAFNCAPSVGLSEPWRLIRLDSPDARHAALHNFEAANTEALSGYRGDRAKLYSTLKLSGMKEAPIQLAIFCDEATDKGERLGAATMPEMRQFSVVSAIMQFWLAARARGLGVGWVSVLDPVRLSRDLAVPEAWRLIAYLCVGWPEQSDDTPELERAGWETRRGQMPIERR
ncbi:MAG: 5,6-dimethylbenzimidazole synthase [Pseudomonadota bacterium]